MLLIMCHKVIVSGNAYVETVWHVTFSLLDVSFGTELSATPLDILRHLDKYYSHGTR